MISESQGGLGARSVGESIRENCAGARPDFVAIKELGRGVCIHRHDGRRRAMTEVIGRVAVNVVPGSPPVNVPVPSKAPTPSAVRAAGASVPRVPARSAIWRSQSQRVAGTARQPVRCISFGLRMLRCLRMPAGSPLFLVPGPSPSVRFQDRLSCSGRTGIRASVILSADFDLQRLGQGSHWIERAVGLSLPVAYREVSGGTRAVGPDIALGPLHGCAAYRAQGVSGGRDGTRHA